MCSKGKTTVTAVFAVRYGRFFGAGPRSGCENAFHSAPAMAIWVPLSSFNRAQTDASSDLRVGDKLVKLLDEVEVSLGGP
jgi:hypothetical protein